MQWLYLASLIAAIGCIALIDRHYHLAYWLDRRRSVLTVAISMAVFIVWDLFGIQLGIFFQGHSEYALPFTLLPEFPVEELFFLCLLCYCTLVIYRGLEKLWQRT